MTLKNDEKSEEKLTSFKIDISNLKNFDSRNLKSHKRAAFGHHFNGLLLTKVYNV